MQVWNFRFATIVGSGLGAVIPNFIKKLHEGPETLTMSAIRDTTTAAPPVPA